MSWAATSTWASPGCPRCWSTSRAPRPGQQGPAVRTRNARAQRRRFLLLDRSLRAEGDACPHRQQTQPRLRRGAEGTEGQVTLRGTGRQDFRSGESAGVRRIRRAKQCAIRTARQAEQRAPELAHLARAGIEAPGWPPAPDPGDTASPAQSQRQMVSPPNRKGVRSCRKPQATSPCASNGTPAAPNRATRSDSVVPKGIRTVMSGRRK